MTRNEYYGMSAYAAYRFPLLYGQAQTNVLLLLTAIEHCLDLRSSASCNVAQRPLHAVSSYIKRCSRQPNR
eukprot:20436-Heterococcus_DN1.PRE.2